MLSTNVCIKFSQNITCPDGSFFIVQLEPCIQITLEFVECFVDLFAKRYTVELIEYRLVKSFTDPIGLGAFGQCDIRDVLAVFTNADSRIGEGRRMAITTATR